MNRFVICIVAVVILLVSNGLTYAQQGGQWTELISRINPQQHAVAGEWQKKDNELACGKANGARIRLPIRPAAEYEIRTSFTRISGVHSIAIIFPHGNGQATFEVDAWGENLAGIQEIDGQKLTNNPTRTDGVRLENGQQYTMTLQVRRNRVLAYLDRRQIASVETDGSNLSMLERRTWELNDSRAIGVGAYDSPTVFHSISYRPIADSSDAPPTLPASRPATQSAPRPSAAASPPPTNARGNDRQVAKGSRGKVLLVIANEGFFYREYGEPRKALEDAGFEVVVGAGSMDVCRPHTNSGYTDGHGRVQPDIAITDARAEDYVAIMFSGGWGSSMYQYAFEGSYSTRPYNGTREIKNAANRLINDFVKQDKYVGALCHGVSVLAWARVNGKSLLEGRNVVSPARSGPHGVYEGQTGKTPSRWNAQVNGAKVSPFRSIGNPRSSHDDVMVDGKIITGEDDISSREFGRTLARLLIEQQNKN